MFKDRSSVGLENSCRFEVKLGVHSATKSQRRAITSSRATNYHAWPKMATRSGFQGSKFARNAAASATLTVHFEAGIQVILTAAC